MRLLLDMNLSPRWVGFLTSAGFDAIHWSAIGASTATDAEIMAHANEHNFVVVTHDLDFSAILAASHGSKPSVVQIRAQDISPEAIGNQILTALRQMRSDLETGALLTIDPNRTRIRILPLGIRPE